MARLLNVEAKSKKTNARSGGDRINASFAGLKTTSMETETKVEHTPGPWEFFNGHSPETEAFTVVPPENDTVSGVGWKSKTISIANQAGEILAEVKAYDTELFLRDFDQWEANAKLIRAAPELLNLLLTSLSFLHDYANIGFSDEYYRKSIRDLEYQIKEVISKARGLK